MKERSSLTHYSSTVICLVQEEHYRHLHPVHAAQLREAGRVLQTLHHRGVHLDYQPTIPSSLRLSIRGQWSVRGRYNEWQISNNLCQEENVAKLFSSPSLPRVCLSTRSPATSSSSWSSSASTPGTGCSWRNRWQWQVVLQKDPSEANPQHNYHEGRAAIRHYANQPAHPLWHLRCRPNFTLRDCGVNVWISSV